MLRFDWIQKSNVICVSFSTRPFANLLVEAKKVGNKISVEMRNVEENKSVVNEIIFEKEVQWPGVLRVIEEEGKVELKCRKVEGEPWRNFGSLVQRCLTNEPSGQRVEYVVTKKEMVARNVYLMELSRKDGVLIYVPIGYHLRVFAPDEG